jgi:hypothetical protein
MDERARQYLKKARDYQPGFTDADVREYYISISRGDFLQAVQSANAVFAATHDTLAFLNDAGWAMFCAGDTAGARMMMRKLEERIGPTYLLSYIDRAGGRKNSFQQLFQQHIAQLRSSVDKGNEDPLNLYFIARDYAVLGVRDSALVWMRKAVDGGWIHFRRGRTDPWLRTLRDDPDFVRLLNQVELHVNEMKRTVSESEG